MNKILSWILRLIPAVILLQSLWFKFTGAEEAVFIFSQLGAEPWGRYFVGVFELITGVGLLVPRWTVYGALLGVFLMIGALLAHFTVLGIEVQGDGGLLFGLGWVVFVCCGILLWMKKKELPFFGNV